MSRYTGHAIPLAAPRHLAFIESFHETNQNNRWQFSRSSVRWKTRDKYGVVCMREARFFYI